MIGENVNGLLLKVWLLSIPAILVNTFPAYWIHFPVTELTYVIAHLPLHNHAIQAPPEKHQAEHRVLA